MVFNWKVFMINDEVSDLCELWFKILEKGFRNLKIYYFYFYIRMLEIFCFVVDQRFNELFFQLVGEMCCFLVVFIVVFIIRMCMVLLLVNYVFCFFK